MHNIMNRGEKVMKIKKISLFIITLIVALVLAACGDDNSNGNNVNEAGNSDANNDAGTTLVEDTRIEAENPSASPALAVERGDTVVVGLQEPGGIFTPYFNTSGYDGNVQSVMFPPLVEIVSPCLVTTDHAKVSVPFFPVALL